MKFIERKRLLKLLEGRVGVSTNITSYSSGSAVPANELLEIYTRRFKSAGSRYSGFPNLLRALENDGLSKIKVHIVSDAEKTHFYFTDKKVHRLIGMLLEN